ncbi:MAG: pseudouridine synthase [Chitinophagales bacterium]
MNRKKENGSRPRTTPDKPSFGGGKRQKPTYQRKPLLPRPTSSANTPHVSAETAAIEKGVQLNKYLSNAGIAARRKCEEFIEEGLVTVNNKVIKEPGYRVQKNDSVKYKGEKVAYGKKVYILLNKPKFHITTTEDDRGRKTVMELINGASTERLFPVGRLDRNTTGLLLFTNDGDLSQRLTHPSKKVKKVYEVTLNKKLELDDLEKIGKGIVLEDGLAMVDEIAYTNDKDKTVVGIELHIGKNRIVRRIFEHLGYTVIKLDRVLYAGLTKKNLPRGEWRELTEREVITLKHLG